MGDVRYDQKRRQRGTHRTVAMLALMVAVLFVSVFLRHGA